MIELYLNNTLIDIDNESIAQTFQINDLGEIKIRKAGFTNKFSIPATPNNVDFFDFLGKDGNISRKPYERVDAQIIENGIPLLTDGIARITNYNGAYQAVIYEGNFSLFDEIKDSSLRDLDFKELNHVMTNNLIANTFKNKERYTYALADYGIGVSEAGGIGAQPNVMLGFICPSLFISSLFDIILDQKGYKRVGNIFSDPRYNEEVLTMSNPNELPTSSSTSVIGGSTFNSAPENITSTTLNNDYQEIYPLPLSTSPIFNNTPTTIIPTVNGFFSIAITLNCSISDGEFKLKILRNGESICFKSLEDGVNNLYTTGIMSIGDEFKFYIVSNPNTNYTNANITYDVSNLTINRISYGSPVLFENMVPDISQADFIRDIMQRYGLIFRNLGDKVYEFIQLKDLLTDKENAEDWSQKYSRNNDIDYTLSGYSRINTMTFNNNQGEGSFNLDNYNLSSKKELFKSVYSIGSFNRFLSGIPMMDIPLRSIVGSYLSGGVVTENELDSYIFKINYHNVDLYTNYVTGTGVLQEITTQDETPFLSKGNINYSSYINDNYQEIINVVNTPIKRTDIFRLTTLDIYEIDFFKLKYIEQLGHYYYLNKVAGYLPGQETKCELIQID